MSSWEASYEPVSGGVMDDIWSGVNSFVSGVGQVGQTVYDTLTGLKQAEYRYENTQNPAVVAQAQAKQTQTMLLIGGAVLLAIVLLK